MSDCFCCHFQDFRDVRKTDWAVLIFSGRGVAEWWALLHVNQRNYQPQNHTQIFEHINLKSLGEPDVWSFYTESSTGACQKEIMRAPGHEGSGGVPDLKYF